MPRRRVTGTPAGRRLRSRPAHLLAAVAAGGVLAVLVVGETPTGSAAASSEERMSVADALGVTAPVDPGAALRQLQLQTSSRSDRVTAQAVAAQAQAAAEQAVLDQQAAAAAQAEAAAAAAAAAEQAATAAAAAEQRAADDAASGNGVSGSGVSEVAEISNSAGSVRPQTQAAANAVVSNVPGADSITLGGTRPSATDPNGHPSGLALDYMVLTDEDLGEAIVQYHIDHWAELGVEYLIYQQRMLSSPGGSWVTMEDRGSATANHDDHVHVNYR